MLNHLCYLCCKIVLVHDKKYDEFLFLLQTSLFGEGGSIYSMQAGPRPGMPGKTLDRKGWIC